MDQGGTGMGGIHLGQALLVVVVCLAVLVDQGVVGTVFCHLVEVVHNLLQQAVLLVGLLWGVHGCWSYHCWGVLLVVVCSDHPVRSQRCWGPETGGICLTRVPRYPPVTVSKSFWGVQKG